MPNIEKIRTGIDRKILQNTHTYPDTGPLSTLERTHTLITLRLDNPQFTKLKKQVLEHHFSEYRHIMPFELTSLTHRIPIIGPLYQGNPTKPTKHQQQPQEHATTQPTSTPPKTI